MIKTNWYTTSCKYYNCSNLNKIEFPSTLTTIEEDAFGGTNLLDTIVAPWTTPINIPAQAIHYDVDAGVPLVYVPVGCVDAYEADDVWGIFNTYEVTGEATFEGIKYRVDHGHMKAYVASTQEGWNLSGRITIPATIYIGDEENALYEVLGIDDGAFNGCYNITNMIIEANITSIGSYVFNNCQDMTTIVLPASLVSIGDYAFANCSSLYSTDLGSCTSLTSIGNYAFQGTAISGITLPESLTTIGTNAFENTELYGIVIPNAVESLGASAFMGCSNLDYAILGTGLTSIEANTFNGANLKAIALPVNITSVGDNAFSNNSSLTDVAILCDQVITSGSTPFGEDVSADTLYVPRSYMNNYKNNNYWGGFSAVKQADLTYDLRINLTLENYQQGNAEQLRNALLADGNLTDAFNVNYNNGVAGPVTAASKISTETGLKYIGLCHKLNIEAYLQLASYDISVEMDEDVYYYYNITNDGTNGETPTVELTHGHTLEGTYSGEIHVPSSVTYDGTTYSVTGIGDYAFYKCTITNASPFSSSVITIGSHAFDEATIGDVDTPFDLHLTRSIGNFAFYKSNIVQFTNYNSLRYVGIDAFAYSSLQSFTVPSGLSSMGMGAFRSCDSLTFVLYNSGAYVPEYCFADCASLDSVVLSTDLTNIRPHAFDGCTSLNYVKFGRNITNIDAEAFKNCPLNHVILPTTWVPEMGNYVFSGDSPSDTSTLYVLDSDRVYKFQQDTQWNAFSRIVPFEEEITHYGLLYTINRYTQTATLAEQGRAISGAILVVDTLTSGGEKFPVKAVADGALANSEELTSVELPATVTEIGAGAFYQCYELQSIDLSHVTTLGTGAFNECRSLQQISLAEGLERIPNTAFRLCTSLTSVDIPSTVTTIGVRAFSSCLQLSSVTLPESLVGIYESAFEQCTQLATIQLPSSLQTIGKQAFYYSGLAGDIVIPASVTSIGELAFRNGYSRYFYCLGTTPATLSGTNPLFLYDTSDQGIYVSSDLVDTYKTAWPDYESYIQALSAKEFEVDGLKYTANISTGEATCVGIADGFTGTEIDIASTVTIMGQECTVTAIGANAFSGCTSVSTIILPASIESVGTDAFSSPNFTEFVCYASNPPAAADAGLDGVNRFDIYCYSAYEDAYNSADGWGDWRDNIYPIDQDITIDGLNYEIDVIRRTAMLLKSDFPDELSVPATFEYNNHTYTVTAIGEDAFTAASNITSLELPATIQRIYYLGNSLRNLQKIACWSTDVPELLYRTCSSDCQVYVPSSVVELYQADDRWSYFYNISEIITTDVAVGDFLYDVNNFALTAGVAQNPDVDYSDISGYVAVPQTIDYADQSYTVTHVLPYGFALTTETDGLQLPPTVTYLGDHAFDIAGYDEVGLVLQLFANCVVTQGESVFHAASDRNCISIEVPESQYEAYEAAAEWDGFELCGVSNGHKELTDDRPTLTSATYYDGNLSYSRTTSGNYATLCVPFDIDLSEAGFTDAYVIADVAFYNTSSSEYTVFFKRVQPGTVVPAGIPMIVRVSGSSISVTNCNTAVLDANMVPETTEMNVYNYSGDAGAMFQKTDATVSFSGTYSELTDDNLYSFTSNADFGPASSVPPFRAYLTIDDPNRTTNNVKWQILEDGTTSIEDIMAKMSSAEKGDIYTLSGMKVGSSTKLNKGIYIVNGKKVLMK